MSLTWKIVTWTTLIITILGGIGSIGNIDKPDFALTIVFAIMISAVCIKCLELGKEINK